MQEPKGSELFNVRCLFESSEKPPQDYLLESLIVSYDQLPDEEGRMHYILKERKDNKEGDVSFKNFRVVHLLEEVLRLMRMRAKRAGEEMSVRYNVRDLVDLTEFAPDSLPKGGK